MIAIAGIAQRAPKSDVTFERLRKAQAEPQNWLTYWGDYSGKHYSSLKQIQTGNVAQLQERWKTQLPGNGILQSTPIVVDGVLYVTGLGVVVAVDARTGKELWKYERAQKVVNPNEGNRRNRGVAVLGNRVFFGTLDAVLIALDAETGQQLWETQVADTMLGYGITQAPLALKDRIIVGIGGGEFGIRGFLDAYDPQTGKRLWRFNTIPGPGEFGHDTWKGDSWQHGGGATWLTGTYDPDLDLLFWPVGNPGPDIDGEIRQGDNLFSCSVVALDPKTGQRKWHYQFTPGDTHDWDSTEDMILVDRMFRGQNRKLLLHADRNGIFYVLDRTNGKFLAGTPFVRQTWNLGFDNNGRPKIVPGSESTVEGSVVFPSLGGGTNFQAPSYDPGTGWFYLEYQESGQKFFRTPAEYQAGRQYQGGRETRVDDPPSAGIRALDPETGKTVWDFKINRGSLNNGVLATAGGILFAASVEGNLIALDAKTGAELWRFPAGNAMASAPISYSVDGKQFVAVMAGSILHVLSLP
jgi:alcohol dehydrogenase (cytochrome c)